MPSFRASATWRAAGWHGRRSAILAIRQQLLERGHVQHAAADEEVAKLLAHGIAAEVFQLTLGPVKTAGAIVLLQHKLALGLLLMQRSHEGRQEMAEADFGHLVSGEMA